MATTAEYVHDLMNLSEDELLAKEEASLDRLEKFMGLYETAEFLVDNVGPDLMSAAMKKLETARPDAVTRYDEPFSYYNENEDIQSAPFDYDDVDYPMDNDQLLDALEQVLENGDENALEDLSEKLKYRRKARLNHVRSSDARSPVNSTRGKFRKLVNTAADEFRDQARQAAHGVTAESRFFAGDFEIIGDDIDTLDFSLNEKAINMLQTAAQKSIQGKGTPSAAAVASLLPKEWSTSSTDDYNLPVVPDFKTASFLPPEFSNPKINATVDNSYSAIAKRTAAAQTIDRPSKIDFKDQEDENQLPDYWKPVKAAPVPNGAATYKSHPEQQGQTQNDLRRMSQTLPKGHVVP